MGRRGGGGFSRSSSSSRSRAPTKSSSSSRTTPAPAPQQSNLPAQPQQTGGGGFLSNVAGGIFSGFTFGTGSAVAHRAIDGIMGPRQVEHVHTGQDQQQQQQPMMQQPLMQQQDQYGNPMYPPGGAQPTQQPVEGPCGSQIYAFRQCMDLNNNDITTCTPFMDQLQQCQRQ